LSKPSHHLPLLYLISNRRAFRRSPEASELSEISEISEISGQLQIEIIGEAASAGCRLIQIREKDLGARALSEFTRAAIERARPYGAKVLVNDRLDVAIAVGADGVHLPVSSLPAAGVRECVSRLGLSDFLIGVSTHSLGEARAAESSGADFIVLGPVYDSPSKRVYGPPLGIEYFAEVCKAVNIPVLALGGIDITNFHEPLRMGAAGIAAIRLFTDRQNLKKNIETILVDAVITSPRENTKQMKQNETNERF
jgi:thiamine-phosphate pyrophosphorylase